MQSKKKIITCITPHVLMFHNEAHVTSGWVSYNIYFFLISKLILLFIRKLTNKTLCKMFINEILQEYQKFSFFI